MSDGIPNPFEGLEAQLRRADRFRDAVDPVAAIAAYRTFTDFLRPRLAESGPPRDCRSRPAPARTAASWLTATATASTSALNLYTFWNSPLDTAPPLVQACIGEMTRLHADLATPLSVLDGTSARELVEIPDWRPTPSIHHPGTSPTSCASACSPPGWHLGRRDLLGARAAPPGGRAAPHRGRPVSALDPPTDRQLVHRRAAVHPAHPPAAARARGVVESGGGIPDYFLYHRIFEGAVRSRARVPRTVGCRAAAVERRQPPAAARHDAAVGSRRAALRRRSLDRAEAQLQVRRRATGLGARPSGLAAPDHRWVMLGALYATQLGPVRRRRPPRPSR